MTRSSAFFAACFLFACGGDSGSTSSAATGVTVRRYRLWVAMGAATRAIVRGESLTTAALDSGFSSSAHLSAAFREMFGLEPSRFARGRLALGGADDGSAGL